MQITNSEIIGSHPAIITKYSIIVHAGTGRAIWVQFNLLKLTIIYTYLNTHKTGGSPPPIFSLLKVSYQKNH
jgi:hypothetical protein